VKDNTDKILSFIERTRADANRIRPLGWNYTVQTCEAIQGFIEALREKGEDAENQRNG